MLRSASAFLTAAFLQTSALSAQDGPVPAVTFRSLLAELTDLDRLWRAPTAGERCVQFSSYDRRSDAGPADAEAWYANADRGQYLREEAGGDRTEYVMVDAAGPGAVVRIWSANPSGTLRFYLDGEERPRWTVDFARLTRGELPGLGEPLCGMRARGCNSHLPIPFARHLKVTADTNDFYYQVNVRSLPAGTAVESFDAALLEREAGAIAAARQVLAGVAGGRGGDLPAWRRPPAVPVGQPLAVPGPAVIRRVDVDVDAADPAARRALARGVALRVRVGDETCVEVPIGDFFAAAPDFRAHAGIGVGVDARGGYCRFPMPVVDGASLELVCDGELPDGAHAALSVAFEPVAAEAVAGAPLFRASWHLARDVPTRPFGDHLVLDATGRGRFAGCALTVRNPSKIWWGEGDEKFFVDGEEFPSTFGTGTEDYFGYAWCDPTVFTSPFHAQSQCDGPGNFGYTCVSRQQVIDAVPFERSFRFDLEVWHWRDVLVDYATTAWWYGAAGARSGLPALPPVADRLPVAMEPPVALAVAGALEGEALRVEVSGGRTQRQDMGGFDAPWSRDAQLWWTGGKPGDVLRAALPVDAAGRYRVEAVLTRANDYAIVRLELDGRPLGEPVDLYSPAVVPTAVLDLGEHDLARGAAMLSLRIVGRNEAAIERYMAGIDYVKLIRVAR